MQKFFIGIQAALFSLLISSFCFADGEDRGVIPGKFAWVTDSIVEQWTQTQDSESEVVEQVLFLNRGHAEKNENETPVDKRYNRRLVITLGFINLGTDYYRFDDSSRLEVSVEHDGKTVRVDAVPTARKTFILPNEPVKKCSFVLKMNNRVFNDIFDKVEIGDISINLLSGKLIIEDAEENSLLDSVEDPGIVSAYSATGSVRTFVFWEPGNSITVKDSLLQINKAHNLLEGEANDDAPFFEIRDDEIESVIGVPNVIDDKASNLLMFMFNSDPVDNDKTAEILSRPLRSNDEFKVGIIPATDLNRYLPWKDMLLLGIFRKCIEKLPESIAPSRYQEVNIKSIVNKENPYKSLMRFAETGDNEAIFIICKNYDPGDHDCFLYDIFPDQESFFLWIKQLADDGFSEAQLNVGLYYENGIVVKEDCNKAIKYYKLSADQDNDEAMVCYANILLRTNSDIFDESMEWYRKAAEKQNRRGQFLLSIMLMNSQDNEENQEGFHWLQESANAGYPSAMYKLAIEYLVGSYVPQDEQKAFELMRSAAVDKEYMKAFDALGDFYLRGIGVEQNSRLAVLCYEIAAMEQIPNSMYWYGRFLCEGFHVEKDVDKGYRFIKDAAKQGSSDAMLFIGLDFFLGNIGKKDDTEAFIWVESAANKGNGRAMAILGDFYVQGIGVKKDIEKGWQLYKQSADKENPYGIFRWGQSLYEQQGINAQMGLKFITAAADRGEKIAQDYLDFLDEEESDSESADNRFSNLNEIYDVNSDFHDIMDDAADEDEDADDEEDADEDVDDSEDD